MKNICAIIIVSLLSITTMAQIPTNGLVGYWPFNENANDESGYGNNGTVHGATLTTDRFGNANKAFSFNGIFNYIEFNQEFVFHQVTDATISLWIYCNSSTQNTFLWSKLDSIDANRFNAYTALYNNNKMRISFDYRESNVNWHQLVNVGDLLFSNWYHYLITRNAYTYSLYINGILIAEVVDINPNLPSAIGWIIGGMKRHTYSFDGKLDDIRIYNRALSQNEITSLYNENNCSNLPSLSISGLNSSYTTSDASVTLTGTPTGGIFYGVGVVGSTFNPSIAGSGNHTIVYVYTNDNGCSKAFCESVSVSSTLVKPVNSQNNSFRIYPNPTSTVLTIDSKNINAQTIEIYDITGTIVIKDKFKSSINISNFSKGIYFLKIIDKEGNILTTEKVVKE